MAAMPASIVVLTDKETSMFATLYGDVRVDEGIHSRELDEGIQQRDG